MARIREDKHGLYIMSDGHIFRPVESRYGYPIFPQDGRYVTDGKSQFVAGPKVDKVRHLSQSPFCKIQSIIGGRTVVEYWASHDSYISISGKNKSSEECWAPEKGRKPRDIARARRIERAILGVGKTVIKKVR